MSKMFAELLGKSDGYSKDKGGSMHIADTESGILGANGIVGAGDNSSCEIKKKMLFKQYAQK